MKLTATRPSGRAYYRRMTWLNGDMRRTRNKTAAGVLRNYPNVCLDSLGKNMEKLVSICSSFSNYIFSTIWNLFNLKAVREFVMSSVLWKQESGNLGQCSVNVVRPRHTVICQTYDGMPQDSASPERSYATIHGLNIYLHISPCPIRMQAYENKA